MLSLARAKPARACPTLTGFGHPDRRLLPWVVVAERITRDDVAHVAALARLELTGEELELFTGQLAAVLDHAADVEALDTDEILPTAHPLSLVNVLRADEPRPSLARDEVLAAAPDVEDDRFRVPPVLGSEP